jgi:hypothetical protein
MMSPRRFAVLAGLCGTVAVAGWVAAVLAGLGSPGIENSGAPIEYSRLASVITRAEHVDAPQATAMGEDGVSVAEMGSFGAALPDPRPLPPPATPPLRIASLSTPDPVEKEAKEAASSGEVADTGSGGAALPDPRPMPPPATPPGRIASLSTPDPVQNEAKEAVRSAEVADMGSGGAAVPDARPIRRPAALPVLFAAVSPAEPVQNAARPAVGSFQALDTCLAPDVCIDQYLWALYERTPKVDTVKVPERIKVTVKKKGKTRTVVKILTKYVTQDFAWKDPIAAQKAGMSLKDYVIGGMDRGFKRKLYHALRAMDDAGLSPGITSGFRDDYRQAIASGNKAATDSSYHGGSRRGGYGHGLAADLVSVRGETRLERCKWSEILWKWIDAHEKELGIGRPYLDKDPPHVAAIDGKEYADKRGRAKAQLAGLANKRDRAKPQLAGLAKNRRHGVAVHDNHGMPKRAKTARSLRAGSIQLSRTQRDGGGRAYDASFASNSAGAGRRPSLPVRVSAP